jgi:hypothetical protein
MQRDHEERKKERKTQKYYRFNGGRLSVISSRQNTQTESNDDQLNYTYYNVQKDTIAAKVQTAAAAAAAAGAAGAVVVVVVVAVVVAVAKQKPQSNPHSDPDNQHTQSPTAETSNNHANTEGTSPYHHHHHHQTYSVSQTATTESVRVCCYYPQHGHQPDPYYKSVEGQM